MNDVSKTQNPTFNRILCIVFLVGITIVPFILTIIFDLAIVKDAYDFYSKKAVAPEGSKQVFYFSYILLTSWFAFLMFFATRLNVKINGEELTDYLTNKITINIIVMFNIMIIFWGVVLNVIEDFTKMKNVDEIIKDAIHAFCSIASIVFVFFLLCCIVKYLSNKDCKDDKDA